MTTVNLLQAFPEVREYYRRRFRHVLVDEYQDTNHAQYCWSASSAARTSRPTTARRAPPAELMVVGDADQSIYAFRGATIRNILAFEEDFPAPRRSCSSRTTAPPRTILSAANAVISRNEGRKPKNLWSDQGQGEQIAVYVADNEHDEAAVRRRRDRPAGRRRRRAKPSDVAVFYRTNAQSRVFEEVFIRTGLPYKVVGGVRFYERKEVRDALAYLRMLANPEDMVSLRRILNVPKRGIGDRAEAAVEVLAARDRISFAAGAAPGPGRPGDGFASANAVKSFIDIGRRARPRWSTRVPPRTTVLERRTAPHRVLRGAAGVPRSPGRDPPGEPG